MGEIIFALIVIGIQLFVVAAVFYGLWKLASLIFKAGHALDKYNKEKK